MQNVVKVRSDNGEHWNLTDFLLQFHYIPSMYFQVTDHQIELLNFPSSMPCQVWKLPETCFLGLPQVILVFHPSYMGKHRVIVHQMLSGTMREDIVPNAQLPILKLQSP